MKALRMTVLNAPTSFHLRCLARTGHIASAASFPKS
jgi:hypothetical protein